MYELKTILPNFDIKLPACMYSVKSLAVTNGLDTSPPQIQPSKDVSELENFVRNLSQQIDIILKGSIEMSSLEVRQAKLFKQLDDLKNQLINIRHQFNLPQLKPQEEQSTLSEVIESAFDDIVINANPKFIPYELLAFRNVCNGIFDIKVKFYLHSNVDKLNKEAEEFQRRLVSEDIPVTSKTAHHFKRQIVRADDNKVPSMNITFIWKDCEYPEIISSDTMYVPIYSEINLLRYLARIGPKEFRYEEQPECNEVDVILDICHQISRCSKTKERSQLLRTLSNRLNKKIFFSGEYMSVADIAVCSILRRFPLTIVDEIPETLKNWLIRMQNISNIFVQPDIEDKRLLKNKKAISINNKKKFI